MRPVAYYSLEPVGFYNNNNDSFFFHLTYFMRHSRLMVKFCSRWLATRFSNDRGLFRHHTYLVKCS